MCPSNVLDKIWQLVFIEMHPVGFVLAIFSAWCCSSIIIADLKHHARKAFVSKTALGAVGCKAQGPPLVGVRFLVESSTANMENCWTKYHWNIDMVWFVCFANKASCCGHGNLWLGERDGWSYGHAWYRSFGVITPQQKRHIKLQRWWYWKINIYMCI